MNWFTGKKEKLTFRLKLDSANGIPPGFTTVRVKLAKGKEGLEGPAAPIVTHGESEGSFVVRMLTAVHDCFISEVKKSSTALHSPPTNPSALNIVR
jgi:hypothetical protein